MWGILRTVVEWRMNEKMIALCCAETLTDNQVNDWSSIQRDAKEYRSKDRCAIAWQCLIVTYKLLMLMRGPDVMMIE